MAEELKGTTTVGMVCSDGVVLATEQRATMGTLIAHKNTKKLFKIDSHIAMTTAGLVGDAQILTRYLSAEAELYRLKRDEEMSIEAAATLMANILSGRRYFPYWVQLIVGGHDNKGGHIFSLDAAGGSIPDDYVATGSGSPYIYGIMEDHYKKGMSMNEGTDLAIRALTAAMKRDAASGDGIVLAQITKKGYEELSEEDINKRKKKMGLN
ncbi:MAG: archaeal proteasome endopeptidase complex subunit beta [Thermoplasmata archaeon]|nr:MAG: archaeal proteasome endopeptidase complex subunit beta [Thermoplasmata archaeon]